MNRIAIAEPTSEAVARFGEVDEPLADGGLGDVALDLPQATPRVYIMRLDQRGLLLLVFAT